MSLSQEMQDRALRSPDRRFDTWVSVASRDWEALVLAATKLEAENAALREFVGVVDDAVFLMANREDGDRFHDARQRLVTDHGLPLPEGEVADDASDDEQHYGPVCSLCGASILFAGFDLCTNCERDMLDD